MALGFFYGCVDDPPGAESLTHRSAEANIRLVRQLAEGEVERRRICTEANQPTRHSTHKHSNRDLVVAKRYKKTMIKKLSLSILFSLSFAFIAGAQIAHAAETNPSAITAISANLQRKENDTSVEYSVDEREIKLAMYLASHKSELLPYAHDLIQTADKYDLPWTLIPAISGVESTFCKRIPYQSYNCWGWRNGAHQFESYPAAIEIVAKTLRTRYFNRGYMTPERIAPIYAPPSTTWGGNVRFFMNKIEQQSVPEYLTLQMEI